MQDKLIALPVIEPLVRALALLCLLARPSQCLYPLIFYSARMMLECQRRAVSEGAEPSRQIPEKRLRTRRSACPRL